MDNYKIEVKQIGGFVLIVINMLLLIKLGEFSNDKVKYTSVNLGIFISEVFLIISIIVTFRKKKLMK